MAIIGKPLFSSGGGPALSDVLRHNLAKEVPSKVERLPVSRLEGSSDEDLAAALFDECKAEPLVLKLEEAEVDVHETSIDVQDVFGGRATVPGLRATKTVPFDGEAQFFKLTPNTWGTNAPYGDVRGNKVTVGMEVRESESEAALQHIDQTLAQIQQQIERQQAQIDEHNAQLPAVIASALQRRRASRGKASDLAARLRGQ